MINKLLSNKSTIVFKNHPTFRSAYGLDYDQHACVLAYVYVHCKSDVGGIAVHFAAASAWAPVSLSRGYVVQAAAFPQPPP